MAPSLPLINPRMGDGAMSITLCRDVYKRQVPYIWKELGTDCRNLPRVHTIVRMMRMIGEIVCPGILLLGEVVMEPEKVAPYFGTVEKPECHMLYNVTTMAAIWNTVAAKDVRLLKSQMETASALPSALSLIHIFLDAHQSDSQICGLWKTGGCDGFI